MYLCPVCGREFEQEHFVVKHALSCWRKEYSNHPVKHAPHIITIAREVNSEIEDFFKKGIENAGSNA